VKNFIDPSKIEQESFVFAELLASHCPLIVARFATQDIQIGLFSVKWFMTLYSSVFKQELFYRVFEVYLSEGWAVLYAVGIAFLRLHQHSILRNNFETNVYLINSAIAQISDH
jgi:hypothetical protein